MSYSHTTRTRKREGRFTLGRTAVPPQTQSGLFTETFFPIEPGVTLVHLSL